MLHTGTLVQRDALTLISAGDEFIVTSGAGAGNKYEYRGSTAGWVQTHDASGAAIVNTRQGTGELTKNRNRSAVAAAYVESTNTVTFTAADNVTHVEYIVRSNSAGTLQADDACLVIYDAGNEAIAAGFFADVGSINTDVMYRIVPFNTVIVEDFAGYLSRIDFLSLTDVVRVSVEAQ